MGEEKKVEVRIPTQGSCLFQTVSDAQWFFTGNRLPTKMKDDYLQEIDRRIKLRRARTGVSEDYKDESSWLIVTTQMLLDKLRQIGIVALSFQCTNDTERLLARADFANETGVVAKEVAGKTRVEWPAIVYVQNSINPDATHVWFCPNNVYWKKTQRKEMILGDQVV